MQKYTSRKFIVMLIQSVVLMVLPLIYKQYEISDTILMTVLVAISSLAAAYTGFNVLSKKYEGQE